MNILICDDDINFMNSFEKLLTDYNGHVYKYTSIENAKNSDVIFDIAFLDIVFETDTLVFSLIDTIREKNNKCIISFVTNHIQYAPEGYEYRAFRYILKNEPQVLIKRRIEDVFIEYNRLSTIIRGSYKGCQFAVAPKDIYFIEIFNHLLKLHTSKGDFDMYCQLNSLHPDLFSWGFVRCHRSFVVNLNYVHSISNNSCFVLNTSSLDKIPIGIRYKTIAKEKYLNYTGENL